VSDQHDDYEVVFMYQQNVESAFLLQIHDMDWIDLAWPWYYKELQTQSTNALDNMMYPKVQKSVAVLCCTVSCNFIDLLKCLVIHRQCQ